MKAYTKEDAEFQDYKDAIKDHVGGYDGRGVPYWVCVKNQNVVGIVVVGEEPLKVIEPLGTIVSVVLIVDYKVSEETMDEFASEALRIAKEQNAAYSFIDLSSDDVSIIESFSKIGYSEAAHSLRMTCPLTEDYPENDIIKFKKIAREDVNDFLEKMKVFMSGSPDVILNTILGNLREFPAQFLDQWYATENLYYIFAGEDLVGLMDMSPQYLNIANIGVSPEHRRKGYGRLIMQESLRLLKEQGVEEGRLRVHADNTAAISLYESFGFTKSDSKRALIWRQ
ncbi:MAG: GNAT family N-acetyltransferase [Candidatus Thorarchaeota archaeon]